MSQKLYPHTCDKCGKGMDEGYIFGDWVACSDACAFDEHYTKEMFDAEWKIINEEYDKGNNVPYDKMENYWTSWEGEERIYTESGEEIA